MNVKLLRRVQKFLLAEPRRFDMCNWIKSADEALVLREPPCGTACCIAGAAVIVADKVKPDLAVEYFAGADIADLATSKLSLNFDQQDRLFYTSEWPRRFRVAYLKAKTPFGRVKVGVARIEHFIKTRGAE